MISASGEMMLSGSTAGYLGYPVVCQNVFFICSHCPIMNPLSLGINCNVSIFPLSSPANKDGCHVGPTIIL